MSTQTRTALSFDELKLAEFPHWTLYLHANQHYLGRAYAWLRREGKVDFLDLTPAEHSELFNIVLPRLVHAYERVFCLDKSSTGPDLLNYQWLCNELSHGHHGHLHVTPRFRDQRSLGGYSFSDSHFGYAPLSSKETPPRSKEVTWLIHYVLQKELACKRKALP